MPPSQATTQHPKASTEFWTGVKEEAPLLVGVAPFGIIIGALGVEIGIDPLVVFFMSSILFGGAGQIIFLQLFLSGAGGITIASTIGMTNLRHVLYSATMVEYLSHLSTRWKILLSYLLTDEAFFISLNRMQNRPPSPYMHYHLLGTGLTLWVSWQITTLIGIIIGEVVPPELNLDFALPLTFLTVLVPQIRSIPAIVALITATSVALIAHEMPWNLWLMTAICTGMLAGYGAEVWQNRRQR